MGGRLGFVEGLFMRACRFGAVAARWDRGVRSYLTLPRHVVGVDSASVQRDQEAGAVISVCQWQSRIAHLLAGRLCLGTRNVSGLFGPQGQVGNQVLLRGITYESISSWPPILEKVIGRFAPGNVG